jgi:cytochrome P450
MSVEGDKITPIHFDRHAPDYIDHFEEITHELQAKCPIAWTETYGGHWVTSGYDEVFEIARNATLLSNDFDDDGTRNGYEGISIPQVRQGTGSKAGFLEMDPPEQRDYRAALNPYLSPAAVARWKPMVEDLTRACLDEKIESGRIDFVDHLANIVPAVSTLALLGLPLADWDVYCAPIHANVYTDPSSPEYPKVIELNVAMITRLTESIVAARANPRPGIVEALLEADICGRTVTNEDISGALTLLLGGGFDTTTSLTAHALEWLSVNPAERARLKENLGDLIDSATEEFLRFYTPAPGDGRTVTRDYELSGRKLEEGDRLWLSWAMANRDPSMFPDGDHIRLDRKHNRHTSFGLGLHRCIGSNVARAVFKVMLTEVLGRMPDFVCDPAGAVHYDTIGVINGMKHLPATFTPGTRQGPGLNETIAKWQAIIDEQNLAEPVTRGPELAPDPV